MERAEDCFLDKERRRFEPDAACPGSTHGTGPPDGVGEIYGALTPERFPKELTKLSPRAGEDALARRSERRISDLGAEACSLRRPGAISPGSCARL
jgi:hypothetical protein